MFDKDRDFKYMMLVGHEITERRKLQEHLEYLSFHDPLTNIPNRRFFKKRLEQTLNEAIRYNRRIAIMYMDLDHFKHINDTWGHDIGDEIIKQFAQRVKGCLRESDTISRQGGDEFAVLLPDIQEELDAVKIAERIITSLQETWQIGNHTFRTTSSIGIAFYPKDGTNRHTLMKHADKALYEAKENGRNNIKIYSP